MAKKRKSKSGARDEPEEPAPLSIQIWPIRTGIGSRIQVSFQDLAGGQFGWYPGKVRARLWPHTVEVVFDDGDEFNVDLNEHVWRQDGKRARR